MNFFQDVIGMLSNPAFLKVVKTLLCYLAFAAAVDALPKPADVKNGFLKWLLAFLHGLAGNVRNAAAAIKLPGSPPPAAMLLIALLPIAYCLLPGQASAQNFTSVTASHIQSDVSGVNLVRGKACFTPTDQNDAPIVVHDGAGGLVSASRPACGAVTSGAIAAAFQVANSATTNPAGIYYRIQVIDLCNGCATANQVVLDLRKVANVSGSSFSLDSYVPTGTVSPPLGNSYWDIPLVASMGNPAAGFLRFFANLGTTQIACLTSAGVNCSPSGSGGIAQRTITGTVNGSNAIFTLPGPPPAGGLLLLENGLMLNSGSGNDYTISGNTITFAIAPAIATQLLAFY